MRKVEHRRKVVEERSWILWSANSGAPKIVRSNKTFRQSNVTAKWQYAVTASNFIISPTDIVAKSLNATILRWESSGSPCFSRNGRRQLVRCHGFLGWWAKMFKFECGTQTKKVKIHTQYLSHSGERPYWVRFRKFQMRLFKLVSLLTFVTFSCPRRLVNVIKPLGSG